jgi:hypothetical protein
MERNVTSKFTDTSRSSSTSPIYIPKFNQPLALEESGGNRKSMEIVLDRLAGVQPPNSGKDEEDFFKMDDL